MTSDSDFLQGYLEPPPTRPPQWGLGSTAGDTLAAGRAASPVPTAPTVPVDATTAPAQPRPRIDPRTADPVDEATNAEFERLHGRSPTYQERQLINMLPYVTRTLGRPPTRIELFQYASQRDDTPASGAPQFEVVPSDHAAPAGGSV